MVFESKAEVKRQVEDWCVNQYTVGFVPTMGALHDGHLSLIDLAKKKADKVVASIYVNPTQFGQGEDFDIYPRTLDQDKYFLEQAGCDALFLPSDHEIYPPGFNTYVVNEDLSAELCGKTRPGHFKGVLTVVLKLFNMVQPTIAVFGKKDFQQYILIRNMVKDLDHPIEIHGAPIVREPGGLAMSSRNKYLNFLERKDAQHIYQSLLATQAEFIQGERSAGRLIEFFQNQIQRIGSLRLDYVEIRDSQDLKPFEKTVTSPARLLCALYLGRVRLIDNIALEEG